MSTASPLLETLRTLYSVMLTASHILSTAQAGVVCCLGEDGRISPDLSVEGARDESSQRAHRSLRHGEPWMCKLVFGESSLHFCTLSCPRSGIALGETCEH